MRTNRPERSFALVFRSGGWVLGAAGAVPDEGRENNRRTDQTEDDHAPPVKAEPRPDHDAREDQPAHEIGPDGEPVARWRALLHAVERSTRVVVSRLAVGLARAFDPSREPATPLPDGCWS